MTRDSKLCAMSRASRLPADRLIWGHALLRAISLEIPHEEDGYWYFKFSSVLSVALH